MILSGLIYRSGWWGVLGLASFLCCLVAYILIRVIEHADSKQKLDAVLRSILIATFGLWPLVMTGIVIAVFSIESLTKTHPLYKLSHALYLGFRPIFLAYQWVFNVWTGWFSDLNIQLGVIGYMVVLIPFLILVSLPVIIVLGLLAKRFLRPKRWRQISRWINWSVLILSASIGAFLISIWLLFMSWQQCEDQVRKSMHTFNAHLKGVCVEQTNKWLCPRTESELKAFNPELYKRLQQCAPTKYFFDTRFENYIWMIKEQDRVYIMSPETYPVGFTIGTLERWKER